MAAAISIFRSLTKLRRGGGAAYSLSDHRAAASTPSRYFSTSAPALSSPIDSSAPSSSQSQENQRGKGWTKWLLFTPGAITFGLGTWQIFRRQEKINMLEHRQKRLEMDPIKWDIIAPSSENLDSLEFRRIQCKGVFDEKKSIFVGPRSRSISGVTENGYYLIMPLMPIPNDPESVQSPILVNRGWVPRDWRDKRLEASKVSEEPSNAKPTPLQVSSTRSWWRFWAKKPKKVEDETQDVIPVEVVGVIRGSEKPSIFVPANDPNSNQWFYVDIPAISHACGLSGSTIYIEHINESVDPSNPYPLPKDASALIRSSVMPHDHLNYTLTWYSLSAAVTFLAFKRIKPKSSRSKFPQPQD